MDNSNSYPIVNRMWPWIGRFDIKPKSVRKSVMHFSGTKEINMIFYTMFSGKYVIKVSYLNIFIWELQT